MNPKPVLVLIHGFPLNHQMWHAQLGPLSSHAHILTPTLRGFDRTVSQAFSIEDLAQDIHQLMCKKQIDSILLGGFSMGGYVALAFTELFPNLVSGLILISTHPYPDTPAVRRSRQMMIAQIKKNEFDPASLITKLLTPDTIRHHPDIVEQITQARIPEQTLIWALEAMSKRPDRSHVLAHFKKPCLIISGDQDTVVPRGASTDMHRLMPQSQLVHIPQAAHLVNLEQADSVNEAISTFLTHC